MKIAIVDSGLGLVSLLKMIVNFRLKHDIDLIFSKNFPLGNCSLSELEETAKDIEDRINKKNYDLVIIMCNTLSTIMRNKSYIKILTDDWQVSLLRSRINTTHFLPPMASSPWTWCSNRTHKKC